MTWASSSTRAAGIATDKASRRRLKASTAAVSKALPRAGFGHEARCEHQSIEFDIRFAECDISESHRF